MQRLCGKCLPCLCFGTHAATRKDGRMPRAVRTVYHAQEGGVMTRTMVLP